jgi:hypothetical protein
MQLIPTIALLSGVFLISGYIPYFLDVLRGKTVPSRASWIIWAFSTAILLFGVLGTGTHEAVWVPVADAVGCFVIFILSIGFGTGGWSRTDQMSFLVCAASLVVWYLTGSALVALIMNLLVYISGYIPTIAKAWKEPRSESLAAWSLFLIGVLLNLLVVAIGHDKGFAIWLYPSVLVAVVGTLYVVLLRRFFAPKEQV